MNEWERDPHYGRELMRRERERLRERAGSLPLRREAPPAPPFAAPLPGFPVEPGSAEERAVYGTGHWVLRVACPACKAAIGMPCFIPAAPSKRPNGGTHPSRRSAATVAMQE